MFENLKAELTKRRLDGRSLARVTGMHENTLYKKLDGKSEFKLSEMELIRKVLKTEAPFEYLFKR